MKRRADGARAVRTEQGTKAPGSAFETASPAPCLSFPTWRNGVAVALPRCARESIRKSLERLSVSTSRRGAGPRGDFAHPEDVLSRGRGQGPLPGPPAAPQLPGAEAQAQRSPGCREQALSTVAGGRRALGWGEPKVSTSRGAPKASAESAPFGVTSSVGRRRRGRDRDATPLGAPEVGGRGASGSLGRAFGDAGTCDRAREAGVRARGAGGVWALCPGRRGWNGRAASPVSTEEAPLAGGPGDPVFLSRPSASAPRPAVTSPGRNRDLEPRAAWGLPGGKRGPEGTPCPAAELGGRARPWASGSCPGGASAQGEEVWSLLDE